MKKLDTSVSPYYDDYDKNKKFYQILFSPSKAVQARELTQLQTILQNQVSTLGDHIFKEGSQVLGGEVAIDQKIGYVKLKDQYNGTDINVNTFLDKIIIGETTGIKAQVVHVEAAANGDPNTLYVKYISGDSAGSVSVFADNELLHTQDNINIKCQAVLSSATGFVTIVQIQQGFYYVNGYFVLVEKQVIVLDKYTNDPSYKVGLEVIEQVISSVDDNTLLDPANESSNYTADGADRYTIILELTKRELDSEDQESFIELVRIEDGELKEKVSNAKYNVLDDTLARRTFDESGHYSVRDFKIDVRNHLDDGTNYGVYTALEGGDADKLAVGLEAGKAYVKGYEVETIATNYIDVDRARDFEFVNNSSTVALLGNYVLVTGLYNLPSITNFPAIDIRSAAVVSPGTAPGSSIGSARVRAIELYSGTAGSGTEKYKLYLFNIVMTGGNTFYNNAKSFYISGSPTFTCDIVLNSGKAELEGTNKISSIFPLPIAPVKSIRSEGLSVDTTYNVKREFTGTTNGSGIITFNANANENFLPYAPSDYSLALTTGGSIGNQIDLTGKVALSGSPLGSSVTITLTGNNSTGVKLIASVTKQVSQEKTKTLSTDNLNVTSPGSTVSLARADIFEIDGIYDSGNPAVNATTGNTNITDRYTLDNGQRDNHYDLGSITLKSGATAPTGRILIVFKYFSHGSGDYFSVDSYSGIAYDEIPTYKASTGQEYSLRDCFDFRPRVANAGTNFTGTGSSTIEYVKADSIIRADFSYYTPRIDKIYVDANGQFGVIKGIPALSPVEPTIPDNTMLLYTIFLNPYTFETDDVIVRMEKNRRYTMKDIGTLDKRISRLEYYTTMSLLEKNTAERKIIDSVTGLDRFKNGFMVDSFTDHIVANATVDEFKCALDLENGFARPTFTKDNFALEFNEDDSTNFQKTGDLITLPYDHVPFITQPYASVAVNVNPFSVFSFTGAIALSPPADEWIDTETLPAQVIADNTNTINGFEGSDGEITFTAWNDWQTDWTGRSTALKSESRAFTSTGIDITGQSGRPWNGDVGSIRTTSINATEVGQSRLGTTINISTTTVTQSMGDRIVSIQSIPFIRSRDVQFTAKKLKPNTRVYPFFEGVDVSDYCKPISGAYDDPLITNSSGEVTGIFSIPNNDIIRFRTGERIFKLTDSNANSVQNESTFGIVTYSASGIIQTTQETILSTRVPQITTSQESESRVKMELTQTTTSVPLYIDPLAQTFLVNDAGGVFLTKVDLFFATKSTNIPVTLQIRATNNGYPGQYILPFADCVKNAADVNVSADASVATTFIFESPVYLLPNTEYAFVVLADSNDYELWTARIGDIQVGTNNTISEQPYAGSMFKSQNASTWTADQTSDIMFNLYKAEFDTTVTANIRLQNADLPTYKARNNPFTTTNGSNQIRVKHVGHGLPAGSSVTIAGVVNGTYNGLAHTYFNGSHTISDVEVDAYYFTAGANATATGQTGGSGITFTQNIQYDLFNPIISEIVLNGSDSRWAYRGTSGKSISGTQTPYIKDSTFFLIEVNDNNTLVAPEMIASAQNETSFLSGDKSFEMLGQFMTDNKNISPVLDTARMSVITVNNRINHPTVDNVDTFVAETVAEGTSSAAKYISKSIAITEPAIALKAFLDVSRPTGSDVEVYYRVLASGSTTSIDQKPWVLLPIQNNYIPSDNPNQFNEYEYQSADIDPFSVYQLKIVMKSTNSSRVPLISNLRVIALGT